MAPSATDRAAIPAAVAVAMMMVAVAVRQPVQSDRPGMKPVAVAQAAPVLAAAPSPPPPVEPLVLVPTTPDEARARNASVPFLPGAMARARPFVFTGADEDRDRAAICLAGAAWYEAGDDRQGQEAVVQVVLNRARHPAYPKTICGVVFQGSERRTGCQFTFTCDGALVRTPSIAAWARARAVADAALAGFVLRRVGTATHYHTDWVVPYWSASLDKIARVGTHLFFRWRGWWGEAAAFAGRVGGTEVPDRRILRFDPDVPPPAGTSVDLIPYDAVLTLERRAEVQVAGVPPDQLRGAIVRLADQDRGDFVLELRAIDPARHAAVARALCGDRALCTVAGWIDPDEVPLALPIRLPALRTASYVYRRSVPASRDQSLWNCGEVRQVDPTKCLPGTGDEGASPNTP